MKLSGQLLCHNVMLMRQLLSFIKEARTTALQAGVPWMQRSCSMGSSRSPGSCPRFLSLVDQKELHGTTIWIASQIPSLFWLSKDVFPRSRTIDCYLPPGCSIVQAKWPGGCYVWSICNLENHLSSITGSSRGQCFPTPAKTRGSDLNATLYNK